MPPFLGLRNGPHYCIARLDGKDVAVDVLGKTPKNPGLSVVDYASSIEETIDWLDKPDNGSASWRDVVQIHRTEPSF